MTVYQTACTRSEPTGKRCRRTLPTAFSWSKRHRNRCSVHGKTTDTCFVHVLSQLRFINRYSVRINVASFNYITIRSRVLVRFVVFFSLNGLSPNYSRVSRILWYHRGILPSLNRNSSLCTSSRTESPIYRILRRNSSPSDVASFFLRITPTCKFTIYRKRCRAGHTIVLRSSLYLRSTRSDRSIKPVPKPIVIVRLWIFMQFHNFFNWHNRSDGTYVKVYFIY